MADKKITNNLRVFKDKETRTLSKADAEAFIKSFKHTLSLTSNPEDVLASFKTINFNVATLKRESVVLNAEFLGKENLDALKAKFPNLNYNESEQTITLPMQPPEEGHVEVYSRDSGTENEPNGGVFEVTITNEQGVKYTCFIDPLGVTIKDLNGIVVAEQRADFESITQEQILDADFSPELIEMIMAGKGPLKSPETIKELSPQLLDLYFKNGVSSAESRLKKDENNALFLGNENGFQIMALPTPKSNEKPPEFYYLIKDKDGRKFVRDGQTFVPFEKFNYIIGHTDKETKDKPFVLFNNNKGHEQNRFVQIPLDSNGNPDPKFAKAIEAFVENNPSRGKGDTVGLDGKPVSKDDKNQIAFQHADIDSAKHIVKQTGISTISADAGQETTPNNINQPQAPNANPPRSSTHSGPRVNPFQKTPLKTIKKPPIKINEDAVRYGGFALTILMIVLAFIMPVAVAPLFGFLAVGVLAGSTVLANNAKAINDNPVNQAYNKYVQTLTKTEREAESEAGKFWEAETERGNAYDRYQEFLAQISGEDFKNSLQGALFNRFIESGLWTEREFKEFWSQDSTEKREVFLEDLQNLYAMQANTQDEINAKTTKQTEFLKKFGILKDNATSTEIEEVLKIFNTPLQAQNPETGEPMEIPADALIKGSIAYLKEFNGQEDKMFKAHDKVGDIIENCSGNTLQKIMSQKGVNFDRFIEEHALDIARRFMFRNDITASQKEELISKFKPEQIDMLKKASEEVRSAIAFTSTTGIIAKGKDDKFVSAIKSLESINNVYTLMNESVVPALKKKSQIEDDTEALLWAIYAEDVKRTTKPEGTTERVNIDSLYKDVEKHSENFTNLIKLQQQIIADPRIKKILGEEIVLFNDNATILSNIAYGQAGQSSINAILQQISNQTNGSLKKDIETVLNLDNSRIEALNNITGGMAEQLYYSKDNGEIFEEPTKEFLNEQISQLKNQFPAFNGYSEKTQELIAKMYINKENVFNKIDDTKSKEKAKEEFVQTLDKIASGDLAQDELARIERKAFDESTIKPKKITSRDEARANVKSFNNLLKDFGITTGIKRKMVLEEASRLAGPLIFTRDMLAQAIFNTSNIDLSDCRLPQEKSAYLKEIFAEIYENQEKIDVSDREKFAKAKALIEEMQQKQLARTKRKLRAKEQIAGREQVEKVFNSSVKGNPIDISIQKGTYTPTRAEIKLANVKKEKSIFNADSTKVLESMKTIGKDMKDPAASKTIIKNQVQNLQDSLEKTFGTKAMKDLFDDEKGKDALSWEKLKEGKITEQEFKVLIEKIKKLIKKKEKKLNNKLKKRKEKANKNNAKGKTKNKAKNGQDIANNNESTNMAIQNVEARNNIESNKETSSSQAFSPAPQASSQSAESGR